MFCDVSTPASGGWNAYDELRSLLVRRGLDSGAIRYMQDAQTDAAKAALFAACRDGTVAVLIGSRRIAIRPRIDTHTTPSGRAWCGDALGMLRDLPDGSVNLICTSPPFALNRKKAYGNQHQDAYLKWFRPFAEEFHRVLTDDGSLVVDIGGSWVPGSPTRSVYHFVSVILRTDDSDGTIGNLAHRLLELPARRVPQGGGPGRLAR